MAYGTKYQIHATNLLSQDWRIDFDYLNYVGNSTELQGTNKFLQLRSTTTDEDRLAPIIGTEALIEIDVSETDSITIADLIATHDSDIRITATRIDDATGEEYIHFQGFVVVEDNNQPLHDKPYILSIRALDGLGLLKGVDLQDTNGNLFTGSQTMMQWIGQILYKTNQTVPIRVYFNFFPKNFAETTALTEFAINAVTFQQGFPATGTDPSVDINAAAADDCYTALEKIIRCLRCRLFFEDGRFMIVSLKEYTNEKYYFAEYTFGTPSGGLVPMVPTQVGNTTYSLQVGKAEMMFPCNENQILYLKLAYKFIKLTYNYDQSLNKVCNQDLSQGNRNASYDEVISSAIIDPSIVPTVNLKTEGYDLYCWDHFNSPPDTSGFPTPYPTVAPTKRAFIRQANDALGYSIGRNIVIDTIAYPSTSYVRTSRFQIDQNDVIQLRFEWRTRISTNVPALQSFVQVLLYGTDGSHWALRSDDDALSTPNSWISVDSNFSTGVGGTPPVTSTNSNGSQNWSSAGVNQSPTTFVKTPVSGDIEILFLGWYGTASDPLEFWYKNVQITIIPFLLGSYQQLKSDYNYSSSNSNIKQNDKEDVQISDSPKRYFKGAILQNDGQTLMPADWHRRGFQGLEIGYYGGSFQSGLRFTQAMERIMFNMLDRMIYKVEGDFKGLTYRDASNFGSLRPAGYLTSYFFADSDFPTKRFILTSFDLNVYLAEGRRVFVEIQNDANDSGFDPPENYKFDYIFQ